MHAGQALDTVGSPQGMNGRKLGAQRGLERSGQHHDPILGALAFAHHQRAAFEVNVLDAQAQALEQTHAGAVEQTRDQGKRHAVRRRLRLRLRIQLRQHGRHLAGREHHRQALVGTRAPDLAHPRQLLAQHLLVQEEQRRQGLLVRGRCDLALGGQPGEKGLDFGLRQLGRVAQIVKANESTHPVHVGLFGAQAVVHVADLLAQEVEQARTWGVWRAGGAGGVGGVRHGLPFEA